MVKKDTCNDNWWNGDKLRYLQKGDKSTHPHSHMWSGGVNSSKAFSSMAWCWNERMRRRFAMCNVWYQMWERYVRAGTNHKRKNFCWSTRQKFSLYNPALPVMVSQSVLRHHCAPTPLCHRALKPPCHVRVHLFSTLLSSNVLRYFGSVNWFAEL